jgi:hypothetical protein
MRTVHATRYVVPLREGGSLPAIVEADDDGMYVLKFRGAGQGPKALIAELVAGEIGRALGLRVPEIVLVEWDSALAQAEPDTEIRELMLASAGLNLGLDYLPGSLAFDPVGTRTVDAEIASAVTWFDAFVMNVDRTPRNPNLLQWHRETWLIDHGASLYFQHDWARAAQTVRSPFPMVRDHVLLPWAKAIRDADAALAPKVTDALLRELVAQVPDEWLAGDGDGAPPEATREAYVSLLADRFAHREVFVEEAVRAHATRV